MSWSPSTDNTSVAGYGEYRGPSRVGSTTQTSTTFNGLTCGTAYQLGVDAVDPAGNRSTRADMTATTAACTDTQAPSAPTNVVVGQRTGTSIALSWGASTDDTGVTEYGLYQGGSLASTTSSTTGIVSGLTCGRSYTLGIDAADGAGNRSPQAVVMVSTTDCADTQPPTAPTGLAASSVTQTTLSLRWAAATDNVGVAGYSVYRNGTLLGQTSSLTYAVSGLTCGTSYTFAVETRDTSGNASTSRTSLAASTSACVDTDPPAVPSGLRASTVAQTSLTLQWTAATDNVGVTAYSVYRNGTLLGQTSSLTYPVSGLTCGTSYTFALESRDAAGNVSVTRASLTVSTAACSPAQPSGGALLWAPPALTNPTTVTVSSSNRVLDLNAGQDYIVKMPSTPLGQNPDRGLPALWVRGGRNVVIIGGEIVINQLAAAGDSNYHQRGLMIGGQSGTIHIEGMWIHGSGMAQAITIENSRGNSGTVQVQNSRLETMHPIWHTADGYPNEIHTDTIQSWNGPTVLKLYQDTFISTGNVLQMQPRQYSQHPLGTWDYRRVNFVNTTPDGYALWKQTATWAEYHEDLWLQTDPRHAWASQHSAWAGNATCWPCWNPGGSWPITGQAFTIGLRPTDFVPVGAAGTGYVSPG
jgi:chitodextrinase